MAEEMRNDTRRLRLLCAQKLEVDSEHPQPLEHAWYLLGLENTFTALCLLSNGEQLGLSRPEVRNVLVYKSLNGNTALLLLLATNGAFV
jgi:hypothetical protein